MLYIDKYNYPDVCSSLRPESRTAWDVGISLCGDGDGGGGIAPPQLRTAAVRIVRLRSSFPLGKTHVPPPRKVLLYPPWLIYTSLPPPILTIGFARHPPPSPPSEGGKWKPCENQPLIWLSMVYGGLRENTGYILVCLFRLMVSGYSSVSFGFRRFCCLISFRAHFFYVM